MEGIQEGIFSGGGILRSLSRKFRKTSSYDWNLIAIVAPGGATGNRICFDVLVLSCYFTGFWGNSYFPCSRPSLGHSTGNNLPASSGVLKANKASGIRQNGISS